MSETEIERRKQARREAREKQERVRRAEIEEWSAACDAEREARQAVERFTEADADTAAFDLALQRMCEAQMRADVLQALKAEVI